ncbi:hypothetical protein [Pseudomonas sp. VB3]|uniref:hypothetical protein n=1 Tax=Pseudomonas sp. VB3 TaxID=2994641 RepID=UPI0022EC8F34|nr:hypothetical protein [Pseudomonas sp. VB3]
MSENSELEPCPYCGGHASLSKVGRDWYRIAADHVTGCPLEDFELDCPQSDDQLPLLLRDWNTRVDRSPSNNAERDKIKDEIETLRIDAARFQFIAQDAESSLERIYGDNWLGVVDQLRGMGEKL